MTCLTRDSLLEQDQVGEITVRGIRCGEPAKIGNRPDVSVARPSSDIDEPAVVSHDDILELFDPPCGSQPVRPRFNDDWDVAREESLCTTKNMTLVSLGIDPYG